MQLKMAVSWIRSIPRLISPAVLLLTTLWLIMVVSSTQLIPHLTSPAAPLLTTMQLN